MRILLLCSSFNGLSQRVWVTLRAAGHHLAIHSWHSPDALRDQVRAIQPDLVLCPYLTQRIPADVWQSVRCVVLHPGPLGDRGPSSLDWAIIDREPVWGVTAISAVEQMDSGPVWGTRTFSIDPDQPPTKSALYGGAVTDAAAQLALEVVANAEDPSFSPRPLSSYAAHERPGRPRPQVRQADRWFDWAEPTAEVVRTVRASDGIPGVRTALAGADVYVHDAQPEYGPCPPGRPGTVLLRQHGAVLVRTGDGAVWVGHLRAAGGPTRSPKLAAAEVLRGRLAGVPRQVEPLIGRPGVDWGGYREIGYDRVGDVGVVTFDVQGGGLTTDQSERLLAVLQYARRQPTRVLLLQGGAIFGNGIHLGAIEAGSNPAAEAWRSINAIDDVCAELLQTTGQRVVAAIGGNAGAGGVMLALAADRVLARASVVLNPHYAGMGLYGSELWTYTLPRRVGPATARRLTTECLPVGAPEAARLGLVDEVLAGDRAGFDQAVLACAQSLADDPGYGACLAAKVAQREAEERTRPLAAYRADELAEMAADIFDDRHDFAARRRAFVTKTAYVAPSVAELA